uniref:ATP-dependent RNA helicase n=1 Tax=Acrobeloides nanus TaxID=290746 RepID=A0A914C984_9BILA
MKNPSEYFESKSNLLNKQPKLASGSDSRFAKPNGIINSTSSLSAVDEEMLSVLQGLYVGVAPKERQYQVPLEEEEEDLLTSAYMPKEAVPNPWDLFENSQTTMSNTKTMQNGVARAEDETNLVSTQGFGCNSNTAPVTNQDFIPNVRANKTYPLRKKHIPQKKTEEQLFDDIEEGPNFEQICNAEIQIIGCGVNELIYPIESYEECGFPQVMLNNILAKKYRKPMPIQKAVLRLFMDKPNDIVAHAQTGSGKSAAYLLPLIHQIHKIKSQYREGINRDSPYALVLLPTKELAIQIYNDAVAFSMGKPIFF